MSFVDKVIKNGVEYDIRDARFPEGAQIDEVYVIQTGEDPTEDITQEQLRYIKEHHPGKIDMRIADKESEIRDVMFLLSEHDEYDVTYVYVAGKEIVRLVVRNDKDTPGRLEAEFDEYDVEGGGDIYYAVDYQIDELFPSWKQGYSPDDSSDDSSSGEYYKLSTHLDKVHTFDNVPPPSRITKNSSLDILLCANDVDYAFDNIAVTMGSDDITASVVHYGDWDGIDPYRTARIYIEDVTGDVYISAVAIQGYTINISTNSGTWVSLESARGGITNGNVVPGGAGVWGGVSWDGKEGYTGVNVSIYIGSQDVTKQYYDDTNHYINIMNINEVVSINVDAIK